MKHKKRGYHYHRLKCFFCRKIIKDMPFKCKYCGKLFCSNHRLPEDHNCIKIKKYHSSSKKWMNIKESRRSPIKYNSQCFIDDKPEPVYLQKKRNIQPTNVPTKVKNKNKYWNFIKINIFVIILVLYFIGAISYSIWTPSPSIKTCEDETWNGFCSSNKPLYCYNETLVENVSYCGCPDGYRNIEEKCEEIPVCAGDILSGYCSPDKPFYCNEGALIQKASKCGCPYSDVREGERCISKYETNSKVVELPEIGSFVVYEGLNNYLSELPDSISYYTTPPTNKDFIIKDIDNKIQKKYLLPLVNRIKEKSSDPNEQARIAIRMVQKIPYDYSGLYGISDGRLPYEVIYDMTGVCGEKSLLLVYLLRELGFGVATFEFELEGHRAVGIKCFSCDYANSGYCFIESTVPTIPTDSEGEYIGVGKLGQYGEIIYIKPGKSLDLSKECKDAKEWNSLLNKGQFLDEYDYYRWFEIVEKYDIEIEY